MSTTAPEITVNPDQKLYVIKNTYGFPCLGFDVAETRIARLTEEGHSPDGPAAPAGTLERYAQYRQACDKAREHYKLTGEKSRAELTPELIGYEGDRVEVTHRWTPEDEPETKRFIVGKSAGWIPCHLEIRTTRSTGVGRVRVGEILKVRVIERNARRRSYRR